MGKRRYLLENLKTSIGMFSCQFLVVLLSLIMLILHNCCLDGTNLSVAAQLCAANHVNLALIEPFVDRMKHSFILEHYVLTFIIFE